MKRKTTNLFFPVFVVVGSGIRDMGSEIRDPRCKKPGSTPINIPDRQQWVPSIFVQTFFEFGFQVEKIFAMEHRCPANNDAGAA
jgi:hypothetical protein